VTGETTPPRCQRCDLPHGTCHHTAPPLDVGDKITEDMATGPWVRAMRLRPNSRVRDAEGGVWVKTRRRDGAWESLTHGAIWPLDHIVDERQGYGPVTIEHIAGRKADKRAKTPA
jgi:hypothetical protein